MRRALRSDAFLSEWAMAGTGKAYSRIAWRWRDMSVGIHFRRHMESVSFDGGLGLFRSALESHVTDLLSLFSSLAWLFLVAQLSS